MEGSDRLRNDLKLQCEQQRLDQRQNTRASANSKRRLKTIHKAMRNYSKR